MKIYKLVQGTPEWDAFRASHHTASEASAMMGVSKHLSRDQLLLYKATGHEKEISKYTEEVVFPNGHAVEALARPFVSEYIGDELYPIVAADDDDQLSVSFDGLTMDETITWECKQWNKEKAATVRSGRVPEEDFWQVVQGLVISRAKKCLYTVTDGTKEQTANVWYSLNADDEKRLMASWKQFDEDLANYVYTPEPELIKAEAVLSLPAVSIEVSGSLAMISNLDEFGGALKDFIGRINKEPETDQDFANLEAAVKILKTAEDKLRSEENRALSQASDIDAMRRTVDLYWTISRDNRLIFDKLVKTQKEVIKNNIMLESRDALLKYIGLLNEGLGGPYVQYNAEFKGAMKGRSKVSTLRSAANDELARAKIEANEAAEKYRANLKALDTLAADYKFLFNDVAVIIDKEPADFVLLVNDRVAKQKQAEANKLEAEREKIRREEKAKLEREEAARVMAENRKRAEEAAQQKTTIVEPERNTGASQLPEDTQNAAEQTADKLVDEFFPANDRPESATVWTVTVTDKHLFIQAALAGLPNTDIDDLDINTDRLIEKACRLNGDLTIPGIKVTDVKAA